MNCLLKLESEVHRKGTRTAFSSRWPGFPLQLTGSWCLRVLGPLCNNFKDFPERFTCICG
jgi:hypothetical protein